ncbi:5,10-methylene tetrahydromethanopterin reductase [Fischerella thermalis CCMEE 5330]|uniref:5,10-methylene tetrahydromethanopterin reductase n=1 Tax=Fischerella thermalis CCMEE 5330 TaxID=2019670 RepID=A0A2N6MNQ1_9CYAN|nr:5,10-methylene tetrahydromethanopterin reductase [Fischerella thermalis CCMEE 5330]
MRFSLRLNNDLTVVDYVELAQIAEEAGFDQFWVSDDLFLRSAPVILTAVALHTRRIQIGTCIVNPYTLHPAEMAMMAATLDEVAGGRFNLGLSAGAGDFLDWVGLPHERPYTLTRETVMALKALFRNERATLDGQALRWTDEAYMRFEVKRPIPIYVGALSPKMLALVGELADGGLPLLFPPEHYANVMPHIARGAAAAERPLDAVDVAACIWVSVGDDRARAEAMLKEKIAYYGHALSPMIWDALGVSQADFAPIAHALQAERDLPRAVSMVTPQMLRIGIAGGVHEVIERLEQLAAMGVQHLSFGPPLGYDLAAAIRTLGREVLPRFR